MRPSAGRLLPLALAAIAACAHVEPPRGGPDDREPPGLLTVAPDSLSTLTDPRAPVVFRFDERISESGVQEAVTVSPRTSPVQIDRGFSSIRVSLRNGWEPGLVYHVSIAREVRDLFNNQLAAPIDLVFSTGATIPNTLLLGSVADRVTGEPPEDVRVEAILLPDSLVYVVPVDSAGAFRMGRLPTGPYQIRAYTDVNQNRELDDFETRDVTTTSLALPDPSTVSLSLVAPDTTPPRIASASVADSGRVELRFDDYLDPAQPLDGGMVAITDSAGVPVAVAGVTMGADPAPVAALDTAAAAPDTAATDTAATATALPVQTLQVQLADGETLAPGATYRVRVQAIRNLVGLVGAPEAELRVPEPPPGVGTPAGDANAPPEAQAEPPEAVPGAP